MTIFKKNSLKISDKTRTRAAELTLRQSIYPLCLVTILFFLWVRTHARVSQNVPTGMTDSPSGFLIRPFGHFE